jgi:hypothetical protein
MDQGEPMKVLVLSTPRSCGSVTVELIKQKFQVSDKSFLSFLSSQYIIRNIITPSKLLDDYYSYLEQTNGPLVCINGPQESPKFERAGKNPLMNFDDFYQNRRDELSPLGPLTISDSNSSVMFVDNQLRSMLSVKDNFVYKTLGTSIDWSLFDKIVIATRQTTDGYFLSQIYNSALLMQKLAEPQRQFLDLIKTQCSNFAPESLPHGFYSDQQVTEFLSAAWDAYQAPVAALPQQEITVTLNEVNNQIDRFFNQKDMLDGLKTQLMTQYPDRCCEIAYETWQLPVADAAQSLSAALGVTVSAADLESLKNQPSGINYQQLITNSQQIIDAFNTALASHS